MIFYDFEVFTHDWLVVILDMDAQKEHVIINDSEQLKAFYEDHKDDIWCGYNSRNYDQFILRAILLDFNPKEVNDWIIVKDKSGWGYSNLFWQISLNNYDVMPNPPIGLKTMEGFMGNNIKESDVPFDIKRKLTADEIAETVKYCRHDVEQTVEVFLERKDSFDAMLQMCQVFKLPLSYLGKTDAGITAKVLDCVKTDWDDEFDFTIEPFIKLEKYQSIMDWFKSAKQDCIKEMQQKTAECLEIINGVHIQGKKNLAKRMLSHYNHNDPEAFRKFFYNRSLTTNICGIPHVNGWGGIHGASEKPIYRKGLILHVDVGSYYPSYLIAHQKITRSAKHPEKYAEVYTTRMALKKAGKKKEQAPYKLLLNALSGAMKDKNNAAYDPCMNNTMVVNCQLMLIMLLEWLEKIPGFELIQSNTDGLIVQIPDTDDAFNMLDDICYEWESACSTERCTIGLAFDQVDFIYQKDVNNYLFKFNGAEKYERKGAYVKELSRLDADLPIINKALVDYMTKGIHPKVTINACDELIQFQKVVKLSSKYEYVKHEQGDSWWVNQVDAYGYPTGKKIKEFSNSVVYSYKCYRVFASIRPTDGRILKCREGNNPAKFGNTPDSCFIVNDDVKDKKCPSHLDKRWYIDLAIKRLGDFGVNL